ncbi:MAG TPA: sigma-54 dependent transcriptional regulator [Nitrospiria bacterium]
MEKILVVDDEKSMRDFLSIVLKKEGYYVSTAEDGEIARQCLEKDIFDLVITDIKMPRMSGLDLLKMVRDFSEETIVLVITAFASTETAIEAMRQGAYDYLTKPFQIEEVKLIIRNALEKRHLREENLLLKRELGEKGALDHIIGKSERIRQVFDLIRKVADSRSNILILGESGTGKELVARAIHFNSKRKEFPIVTVNCSALPEPLLESELFGHMKGSFTGAVANKEGLFEVANNGTIFLDEIGETPPSIQVKLLRVLQEKEFRRIGGTRDIKVDVRIIAATNKDLGKLVSDGLFREDLYYRLDVIPIQLPPLRDRPEDIPLLVNHFLSNYSENSGKKVKAITSDALDLLKTHEWKGNVRELENVLERALALANGDLLRQEDIENHLQRSVFSKDMFLTDLPEEGIDLEDLMGHIEKGFLIKALDRAHWVKKEAAKLLHLNFRSFRYRLSKYGIKKNGQNDPEDFDDLEEFPEEKF